MKNQPGIVMCLNCQEVLVSNWVHDFVRCPCRNETFVDGGRDYLRYGGVDMKLILPLKLVRYPRKKGVRHAGRS
jgi:hypothetical protein